MLWIESDGRFTPIVIYCGTTFLQCHVNPISILGGTQVWILYEIRGGNHSFVSGQNESLFLETRGPVTSDANTVQFYLPNKDGSCLLFAPISRLKTQ